MDTGFHRNDLFFGWISGFINNTKMHTNCLMFCNVIKGFFVEFLRTLIKTCPGGNINHKTFLRIHLLNIMFVNLYINFFNALNIYK